MGRTSSFFIRSSYLCRALTNFSLPFSGASLSPTSITVPCVDEAQSNFNNFSSVINRKCWDRHTQIHREKEKKRERKKEREREKERDRKREKKGEREREKEKERERKRKKERKRERER
ncbi:hypothetical protein FHG87_014864, partial [Trinorchestia longiramus]